MSATTHLGECAAAGGLILRCCKPRCKAWLYCIVTRKSRPFYDTREAAKDGWSFVPDLGWVCGKHVPRLCVLCRQRPAEVPDRDQYPNRRKVVCRSCHADRLRGDLRAIFGERP